ncbi:MAG: PAS domain S-box protein [Nitrospira sp.]|nr:PAS domain S-box protein [Nitrospira sp.]
MISLDQLIPPEDPWSFLKGGGEMGERIRTLDWSRTPLGPVESWTPAQKNTISLMLANRFPLLLWWGPEYISLYNDAYRPILGNKHPGALGQPVRDCWNEIWHILKPLIDVPFQGGPPTWNDDILLEIGRHGFLEETHFTIAYSPVPDHLMPGGIGGVLATVHEITDKVIGERRIGILKDLGAASLERRSAEQTCAAATEVLSRHPRDVSFSLLYVIDADRRCARLAGWSGLSPGQAGAPLVIALNGGTEPEVWPASEALRTEDIQIVRHVERRFPAFPVSPWGEPPKEAAVVPIRSTVPRQAAGFLVAGISARLPFDERYRNFLDLVASRIGTAVAIARAYEAETRRAEALAELDRAKTAFFSNVSHEFRTPLTLMLGPVEELLASSPTALPPAAKTQLEMVSRNGERLLRLVNNLLDFSRIEAGRAQARYEPTDLGAFTAELASCFQSAVERAGLTLTVDCPSLAEPVYVDRGMWEKIVLNLISNAFKFTFEGEIHITLTAATIEAPEGLKHASSPARQAILTVRDTGVGIPAEAIPRLFERFYRAEHMRSRSHKGSGIGLALVQELITLHGGTVRAESLVGDGSRFIVTIPFGSAHLPPGRIGARVSMPPIRGGAAPFVDEVLRWLPEADSVVGRAADKQPEPFKPGATAHAESVPQALDVAPLPGDQSAPRILVVDDNADMRHYVVRLLAERYAVEAAPDGEAALAAARKIRPDLILSDVMMPRLDGFGLLRELRRDPALKTVPVILLSARAGEDSRIEGVEYGADDYLIKPFSARELLARIHAQLGMVRVRRESEARMAAELEAMTRLCETGNRCVQAGEEVTRCLDQFVEAAIALTGASKGNLQVLNRTTGALTIAAHRGFEKSFLDFFAEVRASEKAACGAAMDAHERIVVGDVAQSPLFAGEPSLNVLLAAGVRAVQSTPLISSAGAVLGMISTHFAAPHLPDQMALRLMDLLARQAADYLERKWAEEVLRTSEERLRAMFKQAATGIVVVDLEGRFLEVNERMCQIVHRTREQLLACSCADLTHPDDWSCNRSRMEEVAAGTLEEYVIEKRYGRPDGTWVWVNVAVSALRDGHGQPQGLLAVVQDSDARKRAEQAVRESEARFREMADNAPVMVWVTDQTGFCNFLSQSWYDFTGQTAQAGLGFGWIDAVHPDDRRQARDVFMGASVRSEAFQVEYRLRRRDGAYRWAIDAAAPRRAESGEFLGYIGSVIDITERKQAEERLFEAHALLDSLLLSAPMGFCYMNRQLRYERINPRLAELNGLSVEAHIGKHVSDIVPSLAATVYEVTNRILSTGRPVINHEFSGETAAAPGVTRYWNENWYPVYDQMGEVRGFGVVVEDVTERKAAEAALREAQQRLRQWNVKLEQAVNVKTAELVQSQDRLRAMATELNLAEQRERKRLATELHDHLQQTLVLGKLKMGQGKRLAASMPALADVIEGTDAIFSDALQYTRTLVAELSPPVLRDHGLAAGLNWLADYMKKHEVSVTVVLPKDDGLRLPEDQSMLLFQSVRELLINSWKHGGTGQATVTMERPEGVLRIEVCDQGAGFDPSIVTLQAGTGVSSKFGLLSIRERMRALGGSFEIQSGPNQGTRAILMLPVGGDPWVAESGQPITLAVDPSMNGSTIAPAPSAASAAGIRVLLVDDHAMVRQGLRSMLDAYDDIQVIGEAQDGVEAVRLARELRPRVVVMDISMPNMNGIEATAEIKAQYPDTTVIGLSVNADSENAEAMARAGAMRLLTKEMAVDSLYGAIREAVEAAEPTWEGLFST